MTKRQHPRARFIPREDGTEGPWEVATAEPRIPIPYPIHYWGTWKGLTRSTPLRDTRVTWITDTEICDWAFAFVDARLCGLDCGTGNVHWLNLHDREGTLWDALEKRLEEADPRRAFQMMAGMASEIAWRIELRDDNERFQIWQDFKDVRMWGIYRHHFGSPENPRMEMYL